MNKLNPTIKKNLQVVDKVTLTQVLDKFMTIKNDIDFIDWLKSQIKEDKMSKKYVDAHPHGGDLWPEVKTKKKK